VTFLYKPEYDKGQRTLQFGRSRRKWPRFYPDLVAYDPDGKPYTVKYQYLSTMLLNEVQKQYRRAEAEAKVITEQEEKTEAQQRQMESLQTQMRQQREELQHCCCRPYRGSVR